MSLPTSLSTLLPSLLCGILMLWCPAALQAESADKRPKNGHALSVEVSLEPDALPAKPPVEKPVKPAAPHHLAGQTLGAGHINTHYVEGIDVSHYQGNINWCVVCRYERISYVYIKATEGADLIDDCYERNLRGARQQGLSVGSYHFYRPNVPWQQQFNNMVAVVKTHEQDLVPIIDIEHAGRNEERFIADLTAFIHQVESHYGKKPMLYTYQNFYNKHFVGRFTSYPWMIASYKETAPMLNDQLNYIIWQYSSSSRVQGIGGSVDRSRLMFTHTLERLRL